MNSSQRRLLSSMKSTVLFKEPMHKYTSFRIGGPAEAMSFPYDESELSKIIDMARGEKIPLFVLGKGTNLVVGDHGIQGIVVSLSSALSGGCFRQITKIDEFNGIVRIYAGAGAALSRVLKFTTENGLSGMEFTAGIPGSLGGAVIMNAGSYGREMKDILDTIRIIDRYGKIEDVPAKDILFKYRGASIHGTAVAGAMLRLVKGNPDHIKKTVCNNILRKRMSQPLSKPSAGSIFKNPDGAKAWELIDAVGLRNASVGGASVSGMHANFIVNNGDATANDIVTLIKKIGRKVEKETGTTLELEVKIVGS